MQSTQVMTLSIESIGQFRSSYIAKGQSENTARAYSTDLRMLLQWAGKKLLSMETEFEMTAASWLNATRQEASPKTTGRRLTSLRAFSRWSGFPGLLLDYKVPTPAKSQPHPLPEGVPGLERMIDKARNAEQRALVGLCGYVGLRLGESLATKTNWLNPHTMMLTVRGKGDKERVVPVSPRAWDAISEAFTSAMVSDQFLIHYKDRSARKAVTVLGKKAGLMRAISSHDLRATYATEVFNRTGNMRLVQELLGHANITTTEVYTGVLQSAMIEGVNF